MATSTLELGQVGLNARASHCRVWGATYAYAGGFILFAFVIFISSCWGFVEPTEHGLLQHTITGSVDLTRVYPGGRHFIGWGYNFILFPANLITLSFGNATWDERLSIQARTGPGDAQDSGGQPVRLSLSFQYKLTPERIPEVYRKFGMQWETSYMRFAQQAVTNVAQEFTPRSFWEKREQVERECSRAVSNTLKENGYATIEHLQLMAISFESSYEQTITDIQLQEQLRVTKEFELKSRQVEKEIDLLESMTEAKVEKINAEADREKAVIVNEARAAALYTVQTTKALMYKEMRTHLNWTQSQFLEYVKIKALHEQTGSNLKLGVEATGGMMKVGV